MHEHWESLPRPFKPGMVYPYQTGWVFSFVSGGETYFNRNVTYRYAHEAKEAMRKFVERANDRN